MPNTRVMLWIAFAAILFLNYEAWMRDYPASATLGAEAASGGAAGEAGQSGNGGHQAHGQLAAGEFRAHVGLS